MPKFIFRDKVAIVTGGASGIGRGLSLELALNGAKVIVADLDSKGAEETVAFITQRGGVAGARELDVSRSEAVKDVVEQTFAQYGRLDYMFNNAGINLGGNLEDLKDEHWKPMLDVNLLGIIYGSTYAYQVMLKQGFGHIVNTASLAGLMASFGTTYATTKYAVVGFSQSLRMEAMLHGIKVSVVCPGFVRTPIFEKTFNISVSRADQCEATRQWLATVKMASPEDCARETLKGIVKNKGIITVTPFARHMWRLYRIFPESFMNIFPRKTQNRFSKYFVLVRKLLSI